MTEKILITTIFLIIVACDLSLMAYLFYKWALNISEKDFKSKSLMTEEQRKTNEAINWMQSKEFKMLVRQEFIKQFEKTEQYEVCAELQKQIKQIENGSN
jgi:hypothetical protein